MECSAPIHCEGTPLAALSLQASAEVAARRAHHPAGQSCSLPWKGIILGDSLGAYPKHSVQEAETSVFLFRGKQINMHGIIFDSLGS